MKSLTESCFTVCGIYS